MKKYLLSAAALFLMFGFFYLMASFYYMSFNIAVWSEAARFFVGTMGGFISICAGIATFFTIENNKP